MRKGVLIVTNGSDPLQNYVLSILVKRLQNECYEAMVLSEAHLTQEWLLEAIKEHTPRHVVVNDLILLPEDLTKVKEQTHGVRFYIRDVNTHPSFYKPDLFHLIKEYNSHGIKYLTRTHTIFQFRRLLEKIGMNPEYIQWAPDVYLIRSADPWKYGKEWGTPFKIGHYNRHSTIEENTTLQFMATAEFSFKSNRETQFNMLSVNDFPFSNEIQNLHHMSEDLGVIDLKLFPNLSMRDLEYQIRDLDILSHVSRVDTLLIDAIAASFNVPIVTACGNRILGKYSQVDSDYPSQMANKYLEIFKEGPFRRWWRSTRQKSQMNKFFSDGVKKWLDIFLKS